MTEQDPNAAPPSGQAAPVPQAPAAQPGQAPKDPDDQLPEKFKGKTAAEIAKSYVELEGKLGEHSKEIETARKENKELKALGWLIGQNPDLKKAVEAEIDRLEGKQTPKSGEEPKKPDDTRAAVTGQLIGKFEEDHGLTLIPKEKKVELDRAIGRELVDMLDLTGTKTPSQVIAELPVDRLPIYLKKAYVLATAGDTEERTRSKEFIEARRNQAAVIGSMPSSGVNSGGDELTPGEKESARRMNISEEDWKKQKKEMAQEKY